MPILLLLLALALPAQAEDQAITPETFERLVTGHTLSYRRAGGEYGAEEYLENRRVRWSFLDGQCAEGFWYVEGPQICFIYDTIPDPQCWQFYLRGGRLLARYENNPQGTELIETRRRDGPLYCVGPEVGV